MPPVLGPSVAVADALEVLGGGEGHGAGAVADRQHRELGAGEALLDHDGAAGVPERLARQVLARSRLGPRRGLGDQHALAGGQAVGLDHVEPGQRVEEGERGLDLGEGAVAGRWAPRPRPAPPSSTPWTPRAGRRRRRARTPGGRRPAAGRPARRPAAPRARSRRGRRRRPRGRAVDRAGDARVARGDHHLGCGRAPRPARARARRDPTTQTFIGRLCPRSAVAVAGQASKWRNWSRPGPTPTRVIGTPTCSSRKSR